MREKINVRLSIVTTALLILLSASPFTPLMAQEQLGGMTEAVSTLEKVVFGSNKGKAPLGQRINDLELHVFGTQGAGTVSERLRRLSSFLGISENAEAEAKAGATTESATVDENSQDGRLKATVSSQKLTNSAEQEIDNSFSGHWEGRLAGNDKHVHVVFDLCGINHRFSGTTNWTSPTSGSSRRTVIGFYDPNTRLCVIKDTEVISSDPNRNWYHCPVDRYELRCDKGGMRLLGRFYSAKCNDQGTVKLTRIK